MRACIQRVKNCTVTSGRESSRIGRGLLLLLGIEKGDNSDDINYIAEKVINLRIFPDSFGKMNLSLQDIAGEIMVVSQFTLYGDVRRGRRPSFEKACPPDEARITYNEFVKRLQNMGTRVKEGFFQEIMDVELINDGPVTILLDSKKLF